MMLMTTSNSISVKPRRRRRVIGRVLSRGEKGLWAILSIRTSIEQDISLRSGEARDGRVAPERHARPAPIPARGEAGRSFDPASVGHAVAEFAGVIGVEAGGLGPVDHEE